MAMFNYTQRPGAAAWMVFARIRTCSRPRYTICCRTQCTKFACKRRTRSAVRARALITFFARKWKVGSLCTTYRTKCTKFDISTWHCNVAAPSEVPANVRVEAKSATSIKVTWKSPSYAKVPQKVDGYYVGYREHLGTCPERNGDKLVTAIIIGQSRSDSGYTFKAVEVSDLTNQERKSDELELTIHNLKRNTKYAVIVQACKCYHNSAFERLLLLHHSFSQQEGLRPQVGGRGRANVRVR